MPNYNLKQQPQYPIKTIDTDAPVSLEKLANILNECNAITLCIRSAEGDVRRGGYFFCLKNTANRNEIRLETVEGDLIDIVSREWLVRLINHISGRKFDKEVLRHCQNSINFRTD